MVNAKLTSAHFGTQGQLSQSELLTDGSPHYPRLCKLLTCITLCHAPLSQNGVGLQVQVVPELTCIWTPNHFGPGVTISCDEYSEADSRLRAPKRQR